MNINVTKRLCLPHRSRRQAGLPHRSGAKAGEIATTLALASLVVMIFGVLVGNRATQQVKTITSFGALDTYCGVDCKSNPSERTRIRRQGTVQLQCVKENDAFPGGIATHEVWWDLGPGKACGTNNPNNQNKYSCNGECQLDTQCGTDPTTGIRLKCLDDKSLSPNKKYCRRPDNQTDRQCKGVQQTSSISASVRVIANGVSYSNIDLYLSEIPNPNDLSKGNTVRIETINEVRKATDGTFTHRFDGLKVGSKYAISAAVRNEAGAEKLSNRSIDCVSSPKVLLSDEFCMVALSASSATQNFTITLQPRQTQPTIVPVVPTSKIIPTKTQNSLPIPTTCKLYVYSQITDAKGGQLSLKNPAAWKYENSKKGVDSFKNGFKTDVYHTDDLSKTGIGSYKTNDTITWTLLPDVNEPGYKLAGNNVRVCNYPDGKIDTSQNSNCADHTDYTLPGANSLKTNQITLKCNTKVIVGWWYDKVSTGSFSVQIRQSNGDPATSPLLDTDWYEANNTSFQQASITLTNSQTGTVLPPFPLTQKNGVVDQTFDNVPVGTYSYSINNLPQGLFNTYIDEVKSSYYDENGIKRYEWKKDYAFRLEPRAFDAAGNDTTTITISPKIGSGLTDDEIRASLIKLYNTAPQVRYLTTRKECEDCGGKVLGQITGIWDKQKTVCAPDFKRNAEGNPTKQPKDLAACGKSEDTTPPQNPGGGNITCPSGDNGQSGQPGCDSVDRCDRGGGCNPACGAKGETKSNGEVCDVPNGYCRSAYSCRPTNTGFHLTCVNNACSNQLCPTGQKTCANSCATNGDCQPKAPPRGGGSTNPIPSPVSSACDNAGGSCYQTSSDGKTHFCTGEEGGLSLVGFGMSCPNTGTRQGICCKPVGRRTPLCEFKPNTNPGGTNGPGGICRSGCKTNEKSTGRFQCSTTTPVCCVESTTSSVPVPAQCKSAGGTVCTTNKPLCQSEGRDLGQKDCTSGSTCCAYPTTEGNATLSGEFEVKLDNLPPGSKWVAPTMGALVCKAGTNDCRTFGLLIYPRYTSSQSIFSVTFVASGLALNKSYDFYATALGEKVFVAQILMNKADIKLDGANIINAVGSLIKLDNPSITTTVPPNGTETTVTTSGQVSAFSPQCQPLGIPDSIPLDLSVCSNSRKNCGKSSLHINCTKDKGICMGTFDKKTCRTQFGFSYNYRPVKVGSTYSLFHDLVTPALATFTVKTAPYVLSSTDLTSGLAQLFLGVSKPSGDTVTKTAAYKYNLDLCRVPNFVFNVTIGKEKLALLSTAEVQRMVGNVADLKYCEKGTTNCTVEKLSINGTSPGKSDNTTLSVSYSTQLKVGVTYERRIDGKGPMSGWFVLLPDLTITDKGGNEYHDYADMCNVAAVALLDGLNNNPNFLCNVRPSEFLCQAVCVAGNLGLPIAPRWCSGKVQTEANMQVQLNGFAPAKAAVWVVKTRVLDKSGRAIYNNEQRANISLRDITVPKVPVNKPEIGKYEVSAALVDKSDTPVARLFNSCSTAGSCITTVYKPFVQFTIDANPEANEVRYTYSLDACNLPNALFSINVPGKSPIHIVDIDAVNQIFSNVAEIQYCKLGTKNCKSVALGITDAIDIGSNLTLLRSVYTGPLKKGTTYNRQILGKGFLSNYRLPLDPVTIPPNSGDIVEKHDMTEACAATAENILQGTKDNRSFVCNTKPTPAYCMSACALQPVIPFKLWWCGGSTPPATGTVTISGKITNNCPAWVGWNSQISFLSDKEDDRTDPKDDQIISPVGQRFSYSAQVHINQVYKARLYAARGKEVGGDTCAISETDNIDVKSANVQKDFTIKPKSTAPAGTTTVHGTVTNSCPGYTFENDIQVYASNGRRVKNDRSRLVGSTTLNIPTGQSKTFNLQFNNGLVRTGENVFLWYKYQIPSTCQLNIKNTAVNLGKDNAFDDLKIEPKAGAPTGNTFTISERFTYQNPGKLQFKLDGEYSNITNPSCTDHLGVVTNDGIHQNENGTIESAGTLDVTEYGCLKKGDVVRSRRIAFVPDKRELAMGVSNYQEFIVGQDATINYNMEIKSGAPAPATGKTTVRGTVTNSCPGFTYSGSIFAYSGNAYSGGVSALSQLLNIESGKSATYTIDASKVLSPASVSVNNIPISPFCTLKPLTRTITIGSDNTSDFEIVPKAGGTVPAAKVTVAVVEDDVTIDDDKIRQGLQISTVKAYLCPQGTGTAGTYTSCPNTLLHFTTIAAPKSLHVVADNTVTADDKKTYDIFIRVELPILVGGGVDPSDRSPVSQITTNGDTSIIPQDIVDGVPPKSPFVANFTVTNNNDKAIAGILYKSCNENGGDCDEKLVDVTIDPGQTNNVQDIIESTSFEKRTLSCQLQYEDGTLADCPNKNVVPGDAINFKLAADSTGVTGKAATVLESTDCDGDGVITTLDYVAMLNAYGKTNDTFKCDADLSGNINARDLSQIISLFNSNAE